MPYGWLGSFKLTDKILVEVSPRITKQKENAIYDKLYQKTTKFLRLSWQLLNNAHKGIGFQVVLF